MTEQVIVISFDHRAVQRVKALDSAHRHRRAVRRPTRRRWYRPGASGQRRRAAAALGVRDPRRRAGRARRRPAPSPRGPSSDRACSATLIAAGVDAIGTNHPDVLRSAARRSSRRQPTVIGRLARRACCKRTDVQLFLTSFLGLYAELLCIRWMPAHVRFLSYFTNFILLASFLGLGVGILSARRKLPLGPRTFPLLAAVRRHPDRRHASSSCKIGSAGVLYYGAGEAAPRRPKTRWCCQPRSCWSSLLFVCIGRPLGVLLGQVTPPLRAYALDIGGSLAGHRRVLPAVVVRAAAGWSGSSACWSSPCCWPGRPGSTAPSCSCRWPSRRSSPGTSAELLVVAVLQDRPDADRQRPRLGAQRQRERPPGDAAVGREGALLPRRRTSCSARASSSTC